MQNNILKHKMKNSCNNHIKYSELQPGYKEYHQITISIEYHYIHKAPIPKSPL